MAKQQDRAGMFCLLRLSWLSGAVWEKGMDIGKNKAISLAEHFIWERGEGIGFMNKPTFSNSRALKKH